MGIILFEFCDTILMSMVTGTNLKTKIVSKYNQKFILQNIECLSHNINRERVTTGKIAHNQRKTS